MRNNINRFVAYSPDWEKGGVMVEVKTRLQAVRGVRDSLLEIAHALADQPAKRAFLLLIDPRVTVERLQAEWEKVQMTFRPDIIDRLSIVVSAGDKFVGIPREPEPRDIGLLKQAGHQELPRSGYILPPPDPGSEILKILVYQWFREEGSMTSAWLARTAGCNYRTVAGTLKELGRAIIRHSDRSVELRCFPRDAWTRMIAAPEKSRAAIRYADRSGQPRSLQSLLGRLRKINPRGAALGGVLGARHYCPKLDLVGAPRLDLTIHCPGKQADLGFVEELDPALQRETDPEAPAGLVLHFLRRAESFFPGDSQGLNWADPVECLLDLQEMRLETQALEFLNFLQPGNEGR